VKYIQNKKIDTNKSNNVADLNGISEAVWNFLSAVYNLRWNSLYVDMNNNSFRQKVLVKFTLKINPIITGKKGIRNTDKSVERLLLPILENYPERSMKYQNTSRQQILTKWIAARANHMPRYLRSVALLRKSSKSKMSSLVSR